MADDQPATAPDPTPAAATPALEHPVTPEPEEPPAPEPSTPDAEAPAEAAAEAPAEPPTEATVEAPSAASAEAPVEPVAEVPVEATIDAAVEARTEEAAEAPARRPRTAVLIAAAALLGPLLGAGLGYGLQAAAPATPLPPLKAAQPHYPAAQAAAKAAADAEPKPLAIDGDLRKLLISKPDGATDWDDYGVGDSSGWLTMSEKARAYGNADREFRSFLTEGFRRDAFIAFKKGEAKYRVELIQYGDDYAQSAIDAANDFGLVETEPLPGTATGAVSTPNRTYTFAQSTETYYWGLALARRGTVVMRISVYAPSQVNAEELKDIAKRQWERLA